MKEVEKKSAKTKLVKPKTKAIVKKKAKTNVKAKENRTVVEEPVIDIPVKKKELNHKQQKFCDEYLIDLNATQAAIRAGYKKTSAVAIGYENLRKPYISEIIQEKRKSLQERTELNQEMVLLNLKKIADACMDKIPITDRSGQIIAEAMHNPSAANKSWELLGNHLGMFVSKVDHTTKGEKIDRKIEIEILK